MSERKKVGREVRNVRNAIRERGGYASKNPLRKEIMGKYYKIIGELDPHTLTNLTEEEANKLVEQLRQMEAFIRATKNVK